MRYVMARIKDDERDMIYRIYVTDSLKAIGQLDVRYYDFIKNTPIETRSAEEIIDHIKGKLNDLE